MTKRINTTVIHEGENFNGTRAITSPIFQTATYRASDDLQQQKLEATETKSPLFYHRHGNPTNSQVAAVLAKLEKTEDALVLATGMAAISTAVLALVKAGDHIIVQKAHYAAAQLFFREFLPDYGVQVTEVSQSEVLEFEKAIQPQTKLIYIESPSNPNLEITDIEALGKLAKQKGIFTIVDNTFCSPINQTPTDYGIDAVIHSATKYLGGHSDLTAGAICGSKEFIKKAWKKSLMLGSSLSPFDSWLLLRGLKTLPLRVKQINENALALAQWLQDQEQVKSVNYVGLPTHPQYELAKKQMHGFTGMLCIVIQGETDQESFDNAQTVLANVEIFANAVSLGGVESLITHPSSLWGSVQSESVEKSSFPIGLLRLSVGLEDIEDLKQDLAHAFNQLK